MMKSVWVVAGHEVVAKQQARKDAAVPKNSSGLYLSEPLVSWQMQEYRRGIVGAELVESIYGWSVRYLSGLQNRALLASSRRKQVDGSYESALQWAKNWQAESPLSRYVLDRSKSEAA